MANWMHPQTEERKALIQQRVAEAKQRVTERRKNEKKGQ